MIPSSTRPHMPGTVRSSGARTMWQVEVPMIMTIVPGSVTVAAGTATCASTLATATAVPGSRPVQAAASAVRPPARSPTWSQVPAHLRVHDVGEGADRGRRSRLESGKPSRFDHIAL